MDLIKLNESFMKISLANINFNLRLKKFSKCKKNIFLAKLFFWKSELEKILKNLLIHKKEVKFENMNDICKEYIDSNGLANKYISDFFFKFHKQFACAYTKYINKKIKEDMEIEEKIRVIINNFLELMNITLIELEGIEINCCILTGEDSDLSKDCGKCKECLDVSNYIMLYIIPEYFQFKGVFDKLIESFEMIKKRDDVILIVNYKNMCERMEYYNWKEMGAYKRYQTVKKYFHELYFYNFSDCVDFDEYREELEPHLIYSKDELKKVIDNWRIAQGKSPKYNVK